MTIRSDYLSHCAMSRVILHWTAGTNEVSALDLEHYHFIIDGKGQVHRGDHTIEDNVNTADDDYAAHTRGTNTGSIGISLAGMAGAIERPFKAGKYPINKVQWDEAVACIAQLCKVYHIPPTPQHVMTHAEVQANLNHPQRGKWDIAVLPFDPQFNTAKEVGDRLRAEVAEKMKG